MLSDLKVPEKVAASFIVPMFFLIAYFYGIVGGSDVSTGAPTPHFGVAFWALAIVCTLVEVVVLAKLWFS